MGQVQIKVDQAGHSAGVAGRAREDLATGTAVTLTAVGGSFSSYLWSITWKPVDLQGGSRSGAALTSSRASSTQVTPIDKPGTYRVTLQVDSGSGLGATAADNAVITFYAGPALSADPRFFPRRLPAIGETTEHNVPDSIDPGGNPDGWGREMGRTQLAQQTAAAARTWFDPLFDVYPVAVGDGINDDTSPLNATLALLATAGPGAELRLSKVPVAYMVSGALNFKLLSDFDVRGAGVTIRCLATMPDTPHPATSNPDDYGKDSTLRFDRCNRFTVSGVSVDGNFAARSGLAHPVTEAFNGNVHAQGCQDARFDDMTLSGSLTDGMTFTDNAPAGVGACARIYVGRRVHITGSRRNGISVTACNVFSTLATIDSVASISPTLPAGPGAGVDVEPDNRGTCSNIHIGGDISACNPVASIGAVNVSGKGVAGLLVDAEIHDNNGIGANFAPYAVNATLTSSVTGSATVHVPTTDLTVYDHVRLGPSSEEAVILSIGSGTVTLDHAVTYSSGAAFQSYTPQAYAVTNSRLEGRVTGNSGSGVRVVGLGLERIASKIVGNGDPSSGLGFGLTMFDVDGLTVEPTRIANNAGGGIYGNDTLDSVRRFTLIGCEISDNTSHAANLGGGGQWLLVRAFSDPRGAGYESQPFVLNCHVYSSQSATDLVQAGTVTGSHGGRMHNTIFDNISNNSVPVAGIGGRNNHSLRKTTYGTTALFEDDLHILVPPVGGGVGGNLFVNGRLWCSADSPPAFGSTRPNGAAWQPGDFVVKNTFALGTPLGWECVGAGPLWQPVGGNWGYVAVSYSNNATPLTIDFGFYKIVRVNLSANVVAPVTFANLVPGDRFELEVFQAGTGNTWPGGDWPSNVKWGAAGAPTLSGAGALDAFGGTVTGSGPGIIVRMRALETNIV